MIDLHTHSTCSDGTMKPSALVRLAAEKKLTALALTDHDTLDGLKEASETAQELGIRFIPGIELEIQHHPGEFHLLGLGLKKWEGSGLDQVLHQLKEYRDERNREMLNLIRQDGIDISSDDLKNAAGGKIIARPHFARVLVEKKAARSIRQAFDRFLGVGRKFYIPKKVLTLEEGIELIKNAGGHPVIAHPLSLYLSWGKLPERLAGWKEMGIEGIEAWHSGVNENQGNRLQKIAEDLNLAITGGSDYHGENRKDRVLGMGGGKKPVPDHYLDFLT